MRPRTGAFQADRQSTRSEKTAMQNRPVTVSASRTRVLSPKMKRPRLVQRPKPPRRRPTSTPRRRADAGEGELGDGDLEPPADTDNRQPPDRLAGLGSRAAWPLFWPSPSWSRSEQFRAPLRVRTPTAGRLCPPTFTSRVSIRRQRIRSRVDPGRQCHERRVTGSDRRAGQRPASCGWPQTPPSGAGDSRPSWPGWPIASRSSTTTIRR